MNHLPVLLVALYLAAALGLPLLGRNKKFPAGLFAVGVAGCGLILAAASAWHVAGTGTYSYFPGGHQAPLGIEITIDWVTVFLHLTINLLAVLVLIYSTADLSRELGGGRAKTWYYSLFFLLLAALNGIVMAFDLFNIFVFTEIGTIAACALVAIRPKRLCVEAAFKYLVLSALGSGMVLLGIGLLYMVTGYLNIGAMAQALPKAFAMYPWNVLVALSLFVIGLGTKAALFPLHVWLPDAHSSAPTPSSAALSGLVIKVYAVAMARIIFQAYGAELFSRIPVPDVILVFSTAGIFAGSVLAIGQTDIKRMLAYSSVAQIGYIFLGFALVTMNGIVGGILHIFCHAVMKSLLFLAAGAIIFKTGIRKIEDLAGMGYRMPLTMAAFSIGALSMVGIPGFSGFISKYYLAFGALAADRPVYVAVILLSSLLNAVYFFPIVVRAFFGHKEKQMTWDRLPWAMTVPMVVLAALTVILGILPGGLVRIAELAAGAWLN
ncbi:MAG: monovalent cation/H+ antiporter subunit D family protein [Firmicutes bacterium]|nr:monovalent cation/H+ antiporter subunit D family protein [Bacillota bacterium]